VQGRTPFFYATGMSRRKIPAAEWTRRAQRVGRVGRACFLWATFLCTSKERWLAPRRGAKAFDPVPALALAFPGRLYQRDSQRAKPEAKHESGRLKAELSPLLRRSELLLFVRAKRSNQEKHAPASAPSPRSGLGPLRRRDFSTRHPCLVEKRRASLHVAHAGSCPPPPSLRKGTLGKSTATATATATAKPRTTAQSPKPKAQSPQPTAHSSKLKAQSSKLKAFIR